MALAFIALLAALSGTAIALPGKNSVQGNDLKKNSVTGKKIKKNAVTGTKVKNNSLTGADVREPTLAEVPSAANATNATQLGGAAADDYRRYSGAIPSGKTVIGAWGLHHNNLAATENNFVTISFPLIAPAAITAANINFGPSAAAADDDATCNGSYASPSAPAGKVCIYVSTIVSNVNGLAGFQATNTDAENLFGFSIRGTSIAAGDVDARGSWAYTAP
ncbi:MAG TPA: hypothetical protein VFQ12_11630 [Thermoleophilaceae bacterium]|nr:hypothetical protein [Thermoleophilaceae bacterium]